MSYKTTIGNLPIKTWKDLRDSNIEKQDEDFSCGSASVATILRYFYGKEVYERDILDEVIKVGDDGTASFSDLEKAVKKFNFKAIGLTLNFEKLKNIKIPAIVYLRYRNKDHFSVIRGVNEDGLVWLGDPSWGNRKVSENHFKSMWETRDAENLKGKILLIIPENKSLAKIDKNFFKPPKKNITAIELLTLRR
ncbi:MAG: C39 family peptidase [Pseudomonadota bacterium]